jgi:AcrR family transcriptional regulator
MVKYLMMEKNAPGRPQFEPTESRRGRVMRLIDEGLPQRAIAAQLGCTQPTLRRHFRAELAEGQARRRAAAEAALQRAEAEVVAARLALTELLNGPSPASRDGLSRLREDLAGAAAAFIDAHKGRLRAVSRMPRGHG